MLLGAAGIATSNKKHEWYLNVTDAKLASADTGRCHAGFRPVHIQLWARGSLRSLGGPFFSARSTRCGVVSKQSQTLQGNVFG